MKWYKYARLQAINYAAFIGMGSEADPQGDQTFETGATCGADLPNPATAADFDTFSIDVTLATPECGFDVVSFQLMCLHYHCLIPGLWVIG